MPPLYDDWNGLLGNRDRRKVDNNTYLERRGPDKIALKLHATDILVASDDGTVRADSGGWLTVTTKDRLNNYLRILGWSIGAERGLWYWVLHGSKVSPFTDGDILVPMLSGVYALDAQIHEGGDDKHKRLKREIAAYAARCAAALPLDAAQETCPYCVQDTPGQTAHILRHIAEGACSPAILERALVEGGAGVVVVQAAFGQMPSYLDLARERAKRSVSKYLQKKLASELA